MWQCPECKQSLGAGACLSGPSACPRCGFEIGWTDGVAVFCRAGRVPYARLGESLLPSPAALNPYVRLRWCLAKDANLPIAEYVRGQCVLDIGCGPTLSNPHSAHSADQADRYVGVDISLPFLRSARAENPGLPFQFAAASADRLPFSDKSFDTVILSFVLHHVQRPPSAWFHDVVRICRRHIVIYDHLIASGGPKAFLQRLYLRVADGGYHYLTEAQWAECLAGLRCIRSVQTGRIFRHVIKYVLEVPAVADEWTCRVSSLGVDEPTGPNHAGGQGAHGNGARSSSAPAGRPKP